VPATVTTATVTVIVRTDTVFMNEPDLTHWYLTTLAGHSTIAGYADGPAGAALFDAAEFPLYREDVGDLLVSDSNNGCIRRIYRGHVSTFATLGEDSSPTGLGRDAAGNVYVCQSFNGNIEVVPPSGGTPVTISGGFNEPCGLAVSGNRVYVCNAGMADVDLLTYTGGGITQPSSWSKTDLHYSSAAPEGVAVDAAGNIYVADHFNRDISVLPLGSSTRTVIAGGGVSTEKDGRGLTADFMNPAGIAVDQAGILYVADEGASLRRIVHTGGSLTNPSTWSVTTLVPVGSAPVDGFTGTGKVFGLTGVTCARDGTLYLTEQNDVRRLDRSRN
jgi:sugar lactone lactonase YvrE